MSEPNGTWIQTYTGRRFYPLDPRIDDIDIRDIAHALSNQGRYSGHTPRFYSVAQHSVLVSLTCDPEDALWGLLHDAAEAYLVDLARPIKHSSGFGEYYRFAENNLMRAICGKFDLPIAEPESVKRADRVLLATEARDVISQPRQPGWEKWEQEYGILHEQISPMSPEGAELLFLSRFAMLHSGSPHPAADLIHPTRIVEGATIES